MRTTLSAVILTALACIVYGSAANARPTQSATVPGFRSLTSMHTSWAAPDPAQIVRDGGGVIFFKPDRVSTAGKPRNAKAKLFYITAGSNAKVTGDDCNGYANYSRQTLRVGRKTVELWRFSGSYPGLECEIDVSQNGNPLGPTASIYIYT